MRHSFAFYLYETTSFSTLQCGSWIDAGHSGGYSTTLRSVSVPFNAGRGLMPWKVLNGLEEAMVSVPFNAGRGLMQVQSTKCIVQSNVSVPFNAGRGLMRRDVGGEFVEVTEFQYPSMRVVD